MTGLMRRRANAGMTIPAAPNITSASLNPLLSISNPMWSFNRLSCYLSVPDEPGLHRFADRWGRAGRHDGGPAVRPRWSASDGDRETWRFPSGRSEEHTSELQSLMRISYAV